MKATLTFHTPDKPRGWSVTKLFSGQGHMRNFINYIERTKQYTYDEHYIHPTTPPQ